MYCIVLYCIVFYCIVLYCIVLETKTIFMLYLLLDVAVSSQGMQDHLGAKSANWLAGCVVNLVSNFMKSKLPGEDKRREL